MRFSKSIEQINRLLRDEGIVHFDVLRASGSRLAGVTLEGNHRITMSATVYPNQGEPGYGEATTFRQRNNDLSIEQVASAFGSAYVRATDPRYSDPSAVPLPTGPVEVGDFVKVRTVFGECRGVVIDALTSQRHGVVSLVVRTPDEELTTPVAEARLVAKGR
jgi:hypothetical protein